MKRITITGTVFRLLCGALTLLLLLAAMPQAAGAEGDNLSLNRPVTVSSDSGMYGSEPGRVNDGVNTSFWEADFTQTTVLQWFQIDLEAYCKIEKIALYGRSGGETERKNFEVRASNDPEFGTYAVLGAQGAEPFPADSTWEASVTDDTPYRYIRLTQTVAGYFLVSEFSVFGQSVARADKNLSAGCQATASSDTGAWGSKPGNVCDGDKNSLWEADFSQTTVNQWCAVDLGRPCEIAYVTLYGSNGNDTTRKNFEVQASNDPAFASYSVIGAQGDETFPLGSTWRADSAVSAAFRYVRLIQTKPGYFVVNELTVYGFEESLQTLDFAYTVGGTDAEHLTDSGAPGVRLTLKNNAEEMVKATVLLTLSRGAQVLDAGVSTQEIETEGEGYFDITLREPETGTNGLSLRAYLFRDIGRLQLAREAYQPLLPEQMNQAQEQGAAALETTGASTADSFSLKVDYDALKLIGGGNFSGVDGGNVIVTVMAPDKEGNATQLQEDGSNAPLLYGVYYGRPDADGSFSFDLPLYDKGAGGVYFARASVYYQGEEQPVLSAKDFYGNQTLRRSVLKQFFEVNEGGLDDLLTRYGAEGEQPVLQYDKDNECYREHQDEFQKLFITSRPKLVWNEITELENTLLLSEGVTLLRHEPVTEAVLTKYEKAFGLAVNQYYTETAKKPVAQQMEKDRLASGGFADAAAVRASFDNALLLAAINSAGREEMTEVVRFYQSVLGLDYGSYEPVLINKMLTGGGYTSVEEFQEDFRDRISELEEAKTDSRPSGGGGGGGGSDMRFETPAVTPSAPPKPGTEEDALPFDDLEHVPWAIDGVRFLYERGIRGRSATEFAPDELLRREEGVKMLISALGIVPEDSEGESAFSDVASDDWFRPFVTEAASRGLVSGLGDGRFGVGMAMSRQDFAVMIYRLTGETGAESTAMPEFTDSGDIADYAREAVGSLVQSGVLNGMGDGSFSPHTAVTRAQAAKILYEAFGKEKAK